MWTSLRSRFSPFHLSWLLFGAVLMAMFVVFSVLVPLLEPQKPWSGPVILLLLLGWLIGANVLLYANGCYVCRKPPAMRSWSDARIFGVPIWGIWLWPERTCSDCGADLTKSRSQLR